MVAPGISRKSMDWVAEHKDFVKGYTRLGKFLASQEKTGKISA
jgi:hypothetical protein